MADYQKIIAHFANCDPIMHKLALDFGPSDLLIEKKEMDVFGSLASIIISQQLSVKAAATITARVLKELGEFSPQAVLEANIESLRSSGVSLSKIRYVKALADWIVSGRLPVNDFINMENEEIISILTQVPGLGPWTVQMFLIFELRRKDIFSPGDAGLRRAIKNLYGEEADILEISSKWSPYRSFGCWYLWKSLQNIPVTKKIC